MIKVASVRPGSTEFTRNVVTDDLDSDDLFEAHRDLPAAFIR